MPTNVLLWRCLVVSFCMVLDVAACLPTGDSANAPAVVLWLTSTEPVPADGNTAAILQVATRDAAGGPLTQRGVSLRCSDANVAIEQPGATANDGTATARLRSAQAGRYEITAELVEAGERLTSPRPVTVQFVAVRSATQRPLSLHVEVVPNQAAVASGEVLQVRLLGVTASGPSLAAEEVALTTSTSRDVLTQTTGTLDATGTFTTGLSSTLAGSRVLEARMGPLVAQASFTLHAGPADAEHSFFVLPAEDGTGDGNGSLLVKVYARDAYDNPVPDQRVRLMSPVQGARFVPEEGVADVNGLLEVQLHSTAVGKVAIAASLEDVAPAVGNATRPPRGGGGRRKFCRCCATGPASCAGLQT